ncbi:metallophosphoesterase [Candidatus Liberibacter solanacearum]|uniref:Metallophosphoesterase n=1 Tax=Candidatus Liberibacter solanacearum TaxID=556287 RepID=A0A424FNQ1_9HYPH|nr:metallophosphoesterase [Candidatus Liberibacter solanacearum]RPD37775.1 metallophosphoesterase [Candidatus Liberibacter solanacearum]
MFVLAHISDIHISCPLSFSELSLKRIIGLANWHFSRKKYFSHTMVDLLVNDISSHNINHLAITGDIVNMTTNREISEAIHWLKNIVNPHDISIVLGNHDAYTNSSKKKSLRAWSDYIAGDTPPIEKKQFPYLRVRNNIALIGCSTAIATPPFSANGYFGQEQDHDTSKFLRKAKKEGLFRVIMMHHPPFLDTSTIYNRMFGIKRFKNMILREGAELMLHGHTHRNSLHWIDCAKKLIPVVGIAAACHKKNASYNLFYIEKKHDRWTLRGKRYTLSDSNGVQKNCSNIFNETLSL